MNWLPARGPEPWRSAIEAVVAGGGGVVEVKVGGKAPLSPQGYNSQAASQKNARTVYWNMAYYSSLWAGII